MAGSTVYDLQSTRRADKNAGLVVGSALAGGMHGVELNEGCGDTTSPGAIAAAAWMVLQSPYAIGMCSSPMPSNS